MDLQRLQRNCVIQVGKILLIRPDTDSIPEMPDAGQPMGLLYMAGALESFGYDVIIRDLNRQPIEPALVNEIRSGVISMVGISMLSYVRKEPYELIGLIKEWNSSTKIVIGGVHATTLSTLLVNNFPIDAAVVGEGESTIVQLADLWINGRGNLKDIPGIATFKYGLNSPAVLIKDLDSLKPAYHHTRVDWFGARMAKDRPGCVIDGIRLGDTSFFNISMSRGCIGRCKFCNAFEHWGCKVRFRSVKNIVDEIEFLYKNFGVNLIVFHDDSFALKRKLALEVCHEIVRRDLKILWYTAARVDSIDEELLIAMRRAGCFSIAYGVESGSEIILRNINKSTTKDQIRRAIKLTKDAGIKAYMLLMIGNLGETDKTIIETANLVRETKPDIVSWVGRVMVFPGTEYSNILKHRGELTDEYWLRAENCAPTLYDNFDDHDINRWAGMIETTGGW